MEHMSEKSNMECMFSNGYLNEICYLYTSEKLMIKYGKWNFLTNLASRHRLKFLFVHIWEINNDRKWNICF